MSEARRKLSWEEMFKNSIDSEKARTYFESMLPANEHSCSMCGKMCAMKTTNDILAGNIVELSK